MSVAADIEAAVAAVVAAVDATPVRVRKVPGTLDGDPDAVVVVTVTRHAAAALDFESDRVEYTADVARAERHRGKAADQAAGLVWLGAVRRKLHLPALAGVPAVVQVAIDPGEPFAPPPEKSGLNLTSLRARLTAVEPRG